MELFLSHVTSGEIRVICEQRQSHTFLLWQIPYPDEQVLFHDPLAYGRILYTALFPLASQARHALMQRPDRIMLVAEEADLEAIPWEYLYGPTDEKEQQVECFLATEFPFVRGLPEAQRRSLSFGEHTLRIVAVPANPLSEEVSRLDVESEWMRLQETAASLPFALTLENTYPPTLLQLSNMVDPQHQSVVHFMGHGMQSEKGAVLCFEKENGDLDLVQAEQFVERMNNSALLVTLNSCVSAASGETAFNNLASALVRHQVPYALGMSFRIGDDDARTFSQAFYSHLGHEVSVETALCQARRALYRSRLALKDNPHLGSVGVPVLYTSLSTPAGFGSSKKGKPVIREHRPLAAISMLLHFDGLFQGRAEDLKQIGTYLTGSNVPPVLTIHGGVGSGKTALVCEALRRFAFAWPGGIYVISLENLPDLALLVHDLASLPGLDSQEVTGNLAVTRDLVLTRLPGRHLLIVLDGAETLIAGINEENVTALALAQFLQQLIGQSVHILATSRLPLGWSGEIVHGLSGLTPDEGADCFRQSAPQRLRDIDQFTARKISAQVGGSPLSLHLLGGLFNASDVNLSVFLEESARQLETLANLEQGTHQRSLSSSFRASIQALDANLRVLLRGLCILHAPFLPEVAIAMFDPDTRETESSFSFMRKNLHCLWEHGLLERQELRLPDTQLQLYRLSPVTRFYVEQLPISDNELHELTGRFGLAIATLMLGIAQEFEHRASATVLARRCYEDLERGGGVLTGLVQAWYFHQWGWVLSRLGNPQRGLLLLEQALEIFQASEERAGEAWTLLKMVTGYETLGERQRALELCQEALSIMREIDSRSGEASALNNLAATYNGMGQRERALALYEEALPLMREVGNRAGEASILNNLALLQHEINQPQRALALYEEALPLMREIGNRAGEAITLNNLAMMYNGLGEQERALEFYEEALPIAREIGNYAGEASTLNNLAIVYSDIGQPKRALALYEEALPLMREVGNRAGEASTLNNLAMMYNGLGEQKRALEFYEEAVLLQGAIGDRAGEATTLSNLSLIYREAGQPERALALSEMALSILREVGDRIGEAIALNNLADISFGRGDLQRAGELYEEALSIIRMPGNHPREAIILNNLAELYRERGMPDQALLFYEQTLPIVRRVGDQLSETTILHNLATIYQGKGEPQRALELYERTLRLRREMGDRAGEATTLNNLAVIYKTLNQPQRERELYEQALLIRKEVGDRAGEAVTLNNLAGLYRDMEEPQRALALYEQALLIMREMGDCAGEANVLNGQAFLYQNLHRYDEARQNLELSIQLAEEMERPALVTLGQFGLAIILYRHLNRPDEAIARLTLAIGLLQKPEFPQGADVPPVEYLQQVLATMVQSTPSFREPAGAKFLPEMIQQMVSITIDVMTTNPASQHSWHKRITLMQEDLQQRGSAWQSEIEFCSALLALLTGQMPALLATHPYASAIVAIQQGMAAS